MVGSSGIWRWRANFMMIFATSSLLLQSGERRDECGRWRTWIRQSTQLALDEH